MPTKTKILFALVRGADSGHLFLFESLTPALDSYIALRMIFARVSLLLCTKYYFPENTKLTKVNAEKKTDLENIFSPLL